MLASQAERLLEDAVGDLKMMGKYFGAFLERKEGTMSLKGIEVRGKLPGCLCGQQSMRILGEIQGWVPLSLLFPGGGNVESRGPTRNAPSRQSI